MAKDNPNKQPCTLWFYLDNPEDRRAYDILEGLRGKVYNGITLGRREIVVHALNEMSEEPYMFSPTSDPRARLIAKEVSEVIKGLMDDLIHDIRQGVLTIDNGMEEVEIQEGLSDWMQKTLSSGERDD
jgi:hypothetical protein